MTLSKETRRQHLDHAMRRISEMVGDGFFEDYTFESTTPGLEDLPNTTWSELEDTSILERSPEIMVRKYRVTPNGWVEILRKTGQFQDPETSRRAGKLVAVLKDFVGGRENTEIATDDLILKVEARGLPRGWVLSALKSDLLVALWPTRNYEVRFTTSNMSFMKIPSRFGMDDEGVLA